MGRWGALTVLAAGASFVAADQVEASATALGVEDENVARVVTDYERPS